MSKAKIQTMKVGEYVIHSKPRSAYKTEEAWLNDIWKRNKTNIINTWSKQNPGLKLTRAKFKAQYSQHAQSTKLKKKSSRAKLKSMLGTSSYTNKELIGFLNIIKHCTLAQRNKIRYYQAQSDGTKYRTTKIIPAEYHWDDNYGGYLHISGNFGIKWIPGKDSTDPGWIDVELLNPDLGYIEFFPETE